VRTVQGCHPGRHDQRLAGARDLADQRHVDQLERGELVGRHVQAFQEVDRGVVERRREAVQAARLGLGHQLGLPVPRRVGLPIELVQHLAVPERAFADLEVLVVAVNRDRVGGVGLQLDRVGADVGRRVHQSDRGCVVLVMVRGQFRDDVGRLSGSNLASGDLELRCVHGVPLAGELAGPVSAGSS
jgi:hypothetical protein